MLKNVMIFLFMMPAVSFGKGFSNSYLEAEIPNSWTCETYKKLWICKDFNQKKVDIITYMRAKLTGAGESFLNYESLLKKPRTTSNQKGSSITSTVKDVKRISINGYTWVKALHSNSELENYYTYYLFTTKNNISIAINISLHKSVFKKNQKLVQNFINSLKVKNISIVPKSKANLAGDSSSTATSFLGLNKDEIFTFSIKKILTGLMILASVVFIVYAVKK